MLKGKFFSGFFSYSSFRSFVFFSPWVTSKKGHPSESHSDLQLVIICLQSSDSSRADKGRKLRVLSDPQIDLLLLHFFFFFPGRCLFYMPTQCVIWVLRQFRPAPTVIHHSLLANATDPEDMRCLSG